MKTFLGLVVALLLSGCASTIDKKVDGFPQDLDISVVLKTEKEIKEYCGQYLTPFYRVFGSALACAEVDLDTHSCTIYMTKWTSTWIILHEKSHCEGGDHDGILQKYFNEWRKQHDNHVTESDS